MAKENNFTVKVTRGIVATKEGNTKAFGVSVSVSTGDTELFTVNDLSIIDGQKGMFVSYPSRPYQDKEGKTKYLSIFFVGEKSPLNKLIADAVLEWFDAQ